MYWRRPRRAPIGRPPPTTLPYVARSARIPKSACAPPWWTRKPETTSSKTSAVSDSSVIGADLAQELARLQLGTAALHRLDEDGGELGAVRPQDSSALGLAVVEHEDVVDHALRDARGDRHAQLPPPARSDEDLVEDAVVGAGEHRDRVAAGHGAGDADRGGDGLGARVAERHALHPDHGRDAAGDLARERRLRADLDPLRRAAPRSPRG